MRRCRLWRYHPDGGGDRFALPGGDRRTWTPCHEPITDGSAGCRDCYTALLGCLNAKVRLEVAKDDRTPDWVLHALSTDGDDAVATAASFRAGVAVLPSVFGDDDSEAPAAAEPPGKEAAPPAPLPVPLPAPLPVPHATTASKDET